LVARADAERRTVERNLHDGAQQRLVTVALGLRLAQRRLDPAADPELARLLASTADGAEAALVELRDLARGVHPALLTDAGLGPAPADLVDRTPLPVTLTAPPLPALPAALAGTGYFVVAEALTNILKHAAADRVEVDVAVTADRLTVTVHDDGNGGAAIRDGGGLGGLHDRVRALGGRFTVESPVGGGTTVAALLPLERA
jgi:signal transduction histidine kinase